MPARLVSPPWQQGVVSLSSCSTVPLIRGAAPQLLRVAMRWESRGLRSTPPPSSIPSNVALTYVAP